MNNDNIPWYLLLLLPNLLGITFFFFKKKTLLWHHHNISLHWLSNQQNDNNNKVLKKKEIIHFGHRIATHAKKGKRIKPLTIILPPIVNPPSKKWLFTHCFDRVDIVCFMWTRLYVNKYLAFIMGSIYNGVFDELGKLATNLCICCFSLFDWIDRERIALTR